MYQSNFVLILMLCFTLLACSSDEQSDNMGDKDNSDVEKEETEFSNTEKDIDDQSDSEIEDIEKDEVASSDSDFSEIEKENNEIDNSDSIETTPQVDGDFPMGDGDYDYNYESEYDPPSDRDTFEKEEESYIDGDIDTNSYPSFVPIQAGVFWMGSPNGEVPCPADYPPGDCTAELGRHTSSEPLHKVALTYDFEMQIHEVTQNNWNTLIPFNPS